MIILYEFYLKICELIMNIINEIDLASCFDFFNFFEFLLKIETCEKLTTLHFYISLSLKINIVF